MSCAHHYLLNSDNTGRCKHCGQAVRFPTIVDDEDMPDYWPRPSERKPLLKKFRRDGIHTVGRQASPFYYGGGVESRQHSTRSIMTLDSGWRLYG